LHFQGPSDFNFLKREREEREREETERRDISERDKEIEGRETYTI
jgi:hypothetical protein